MSEETMLTIKTKFDPQGIKDLETQLSKSLDNLARKVNDFNKSAIVEPDTKGFQKAIDEIEKILGDLTARRQIVLEKPKTDTARKELSKIESLIRQVTRKREILVEFDKKGVNAVTESAQKLVNAFKGITSEATKTAAKVVAGNATMGKSFEGILKSITGMSTALAGPLAVALSGVVAGVAHYVIGTSEADDTTKRYGKTINEISDYYLDLARSTKAAKDGTQNFVDTQLKAIDAQKEISRNRLAGYVEEIRQLEEVQKMQRAVSILGQESAITPGFDKFDEYSAKLVEIRDRLQEAAKDQTTFQAAVDAAGIEVATALSWLERFKKQDDGTRGRSTEVDRLTERFEALAKAIFGASKELKNISTLQVDEKAIAAPMENKIKEAFKHTSTGIRELRVKAVADAKEMVAAAATMGESYQKQAASVLAQAKKDLDDYGKRLNKTGATAKKKKVDAVAELTASYKAQQEIANQTVANREELTGTLYVLERDYYAKLEILVRANAEKQIAEFNRLSELKRSGSKKVTDAQVAEARKSADAQIAELQRIQDVNKGFADQSARISEGMYQARKAVARSTISDEEKLEEELLEIERAHLQERLAMIEAEMRAELEKNKAIKDDTLATFAAIKAAADKLKGKGNKKDDDPNNLWHGSKAMQEVASYTSMVTSHLNNIASSVGDFLNEQYDARISALDAALDRELRLIDIAWEREKAMYEAQLEQYEDLEKRKEELTEEHQERLEDLNWKTQDHLEEAEWQRIMDQRTAEEEKYAEDMARLEEETLQRDTIRLQQEQAETEYLARKEQLEKEYAIRRAKLEQKQAQAQKQQALFAAVINIAEGITKAFAQGGWILGSVFAALVAAAGAIQIATISARPLPEIPSFHTGGTIGADNIHQYGYLPGPDNPYDKTLFWGQRGEEVLNLHESEAYRALKAQGLGLGALTDCLYARQAEAEYINNTVIESPTVNNHNTQHVTYAVKNELTFGEARRLQRKANRAFVRSLG